MYEILSRKDCRMIFDPLRFARPEHNLALLYEPDTIRFEQAEIELNDEGQNKRLSVLRAEDSGRTYYNAGFPHFDSRQKSRAKSYYLFASAHAEPQFFAPEQKCKYHELFSEMDAAEESVRNRIYSHLLDSRNYGKRLSARIIDNKPHIFMETYNYDDPESGEYYQMDYCGGFYTFTVSDRSRFMEMYLPRRRYAQIFGGCNATVTERYSSASDITDAIARIRQNGSYEDRRMLPRMAHRIQAFHRMQADIQMMQRKLKNGKAHIRSREQFCSCDAGAKYVAAMEIMMLYHAEKAFHCENLNHFDWQEKCVEFYRRSQKKAVFRLCDGRTVRLSRKDLVKGYELGLNTIEEIGQFLLTYGGLSIRACLRLEGEKS